MTTTKNDLYPLRMTAWIKDESGKLSLFVSDSANRQICTIRERELSKAGQAIPVYHLYDVNGKFVCAEMSLPHMMKEQVRRRAPELQKAAIEKEIKSRTEDLEKGQAEKEKDHGKRLEK